MQGPLFQRFSRSGRRTSQPLGENGNSVDRSVMTKSFLHNDLRRGCAAYRNASGQEKRRQVGSACHAVQSIVESKEPKESSASVGGRWVVVVIIEQRMGCSCRGCAAVE